MSSQRRVFPRREPGKWIFFLVSVSGDLQLAGLVFSDIRRRVKSGLGYTVHAAGLCAHMCECVRTRVSLLRLLRPT